MDLSVKLGKLLLKTPLIAASGTFGFGSELKNFVDFSFIGSLITKTITTNPRAGNIPPRIYETECGVLNSVGLENPGLEIFLKEKLPLIKQLDTKCIVSVGGFSHQEYEHIVQKLSQKQGIDALEINLSCPNLHLKKLISQSAQSTYRLTRKLRKLTKKPLFVKITPEVTNIVQIAKAVQDGGSDGLSLVNTFFSLAINIETRKPYLGNIYGGYSGKAIKPLSLYRVWKVAQKLKIPIIGGGGIDSASDAIEFMLAGSAAISLGTVNLVNPNSAKHILKGIKEYLKKHNIGNVEQLTGGIIV